MKLDIRKILCEYDSHYWDNAGTTVVIKEHIKDWLKSKIVHIKDGDWADTVRIENKCIDNLIKELER